MSRGNRALDRRLTPSAVNDVLQNTIIAARLEHPEEYSAHSLRAGFVTYRTAARCSFEPASDDDGFVFVAVRVVRDGADEDR